MLKEVTASRLEATSRDSGWLKITCIIGFASTAIPTAAGIETNIVTFMDFATFARTLFLSPFSASLDMLGIRAVAMADASAIGMLDIFVPFAMALKSVATTDSFKSITSIISF